MGVPKMSLKEEKLLCETYFVLVFFPISDFSAFENWEYC